MFDTYLFGNVSSYSNYSESFVFSGHGDGRLKRSGTIWNEMKRSETVDHGHGTFPAKKERFTVEEHAVIRFPPFVDLILRSIPTRSSSSYAYD